MELTAIAVTGMISFPGGPIEESIRSGYVLIAAESPLSGLNGTGVARRVADWQEPAAGRPRQFHPQVQTRGGLQAGSNGWSMESENR